MLFNSFDFVIFFVVVLIVAGMLPHRPRLYFLLGASYFFYGYWKWQYTGLLLLSTLIDYVAARHMPGATEKGRKMLLLISVVMNLSLLGIFKYYNFFAGSVTRWLDLNAPLLEVLLPVGISFYTFQSMSYTIDVYRGVLQPRRNFAEFALYVSFFPQLVAGPIVRARDFLPQLDFKTVASSEQIRSGMHLILRGFIEKMIIADNLAPVVDSIYANPGAHSGADLWIATYCFAFQIFCDFAGYTDIARGCARLLGYEFLQNFRRPYLAHNIVDFWRRWHISLSTWLRDYLYIPLGGSRKGKWKTYRNLLITMVLGGLWHGANWTFLIWGTYHGILLAVTRFAGARLSPLRSGLLRACGVVVTFQLVCVGWVFFRAENLQHATGMLSRMFEFPLGETTLLSYALLCALLFAAMAVDEYAAVGERFEKWPLPVRAFVILLALLSLAIFIPSRGTPFIYFQF